MSIKSRFLSVLRFRLLSILALTLCLSLNANAATYLVNDTGSDVTTEGCAAATRCTLPGAVRADIMDEQESDIVFDARVFADKQTITLAGEQMAFFKGGKRRLPVRKRAWLFSPTTPAPSFIFFRAPMSP